MNRSLTSIVSPTPRREYLSVSSSNPEVATAAKLGAALRVEAVSPGSATVTVMATDPDGMTGADKFDVFVSDRPLAPRLALPARRLAALGARGALSTDR